ncbi:MAG: hypothetical protein FJ221_03050 [Lentisphaerae bacterium]|nr:hypothetical protein [Lentisphaerota bacterium]
MSMQSETGCCPRFDPAPWDAKEIVWKGRRFLRDRVRSFLHIPLNFGAVMRRCDARIRAAGAESPEMIVVADENSLWGADVYVAVSGDVPGHPVVTLDGTYLSRVFEGPYSQMRAWISDMMRHVAERGRKVEKLLFFYPTCPKCAKVYGKNYVVILARV